ncbi:DNA-binding protein-like protein HGH1 [Mollisia scopiformis]|uniref:Protein HGH1 homolog n=1 Tax=Mollisia scopiformis TaxID=149040 RepID=A0A132B697_MOLSC|nr:DNA-binding protein-like protein HGH1 [Mollisia scopiformis]KUJ07414.1 DNA-binding protein-like protein HGH1 [Mollisia scopiformis]
MPTELEELVEFISHGNTQIRQLAVENLVPYSLSQPTVFKTNQLLPIKDLKLLVRDYKQIARDAITILLNLSTDREVLNHLASDQEFMNTLLDRVTNPSEPNANLISMLLANLAKYDDLKEIISLERPAPKELSSNNRAIDQLLDLFVKGADGTYNKEADFDYLSYLFADLAKHKEGRKYFLTKQEYDGVVPLTKLTVFTEHKSDIRRKGVASTIKNVAFEVEAHPSFLSEDEINILPYLLLPITGNEEYEEDDMLNMLPDLQLLPPDKTRDSNPTIIQTHVETLMLLTTTREGRDIMRDIKVYPIIRETHLQVEDDDVREACERLVQVLMRDEEGEEKVDAGMAALDRKPKRRLEPPKNSSVLGGWANQEGGEDDDEDDDDKIVEV